MRDGDKDALGTDIRLLGGMLGEVIRQVAGGNAFELEEHLRGRAKELRTSHSVEEARRLRDELERLELADLRTLIRAFTVFFDLVNLAEQRARIRVLRARTRQADPLPIAESVESALRQLRLRGVTAQQLQEFFAQAQLVPTFTAHPSEARRRTVLDKLRHMNQAMDQLERQDLLPRERERCRRDMKEEIESLWQSDLVRVLRPTVLDEVRHGLEVVEGTLLEVVPRLYRDLEDGMEKVYPELVGRLPSLVRFRSWIGGDRDGNPNVDHLTTAKTVAMHQQAILEVYLQRMNDLGRRLSQTTQFAPLSPELAASLKADCELLPEVSPSAGHEPYRLKCRAIVARLERTRRYLETLDLRWSEDPVAPPPGVYLGGDELHDDLRLMMDSLEASKAHAAANGALRDMARLVDVFGLHLMTLDIRQHSGRHTNALHEVFAWAGVCSHYATLSADEKFGLLASELESSRPLIPTHLPFSEETVEVIQTFRSIAAILERQCPEAVQTYIISLTTQPAHLLEVLLFCREAGLFRPSAGVSRLDIVPLFETLEALHSGVAILTQLLELPVYRRHVALRGDRQEVMIGYSDSNKESGFLQSVWALYRVQIELKEMGERAGVAVPFFHGRGGSIGRGGGPANKGIQAQPAGTVAGRLRLTEQGEMIADRYGHPAIAERHLDQVLHATLLASFPTEDAAPPADWEAIMERLASSSRGHYRALVYEDPDFLRYFEQATPIEEIAQLKLGSRPSRRTTSRRIDDLRAIPWVFSWMQSRHTLPGWYGLGSAMEEYINDEPNGLETLQAMYERWPFWNTAIANAEMILSKADLTIARLYADLVVDQRLASRVFGRIEQEYNRSVKMVCRVAKQGALLERMPVLQRSIQQRNPYVDPLSFIQTVLLRRLRSGDSGEELQAGVLESINGVAAGLKNTG